MATIQAKMSRGQKYWYIVESRRVNGKPRPVVLAYLGKAESLLERLNGAELRGKVKSYSHGGVAAMLQMAQKLDLVNLINAHVNGECSYRTAKPIRNKLTAGATLVLAAIGRACCPTSKRSWGEWANGTSLEYLLRANFSKLDSQHFWDMMDCIAEDAIPDIEESIIRRVKDAFGLDMRTLLYDTTNFYTFINSQNHRCKIAQRGKNKQGRINLRQVGMALLVTQHDSVPLFHHTYQGNRNDSPVFAELISGIKTRLLAIGLDLKEHTIVFDRGCNSKDNLKLIADLHYVGALTPAHHQDLISDAELGFQPLSLNDRSVQAFRDKRTIWDAERTVVVYISEKLRQGQLRGIYQELSKKEKQLQELADSLAKPNAKRRTEEELNAKIKSKLSGQFMADLIDWRLVEEDGRLRLHFMRNAQALSSVEDELGFRILMTDRHEWSTEQIIQTYHAQAAVEHAFKNIKNPHHLAVTPGYHWTDHKICVHYFICVLAYLMTTLLWRTAKEKGGYPHSMDSLMDDLNAIRLAALIDNQKRGRPKVNYQIEELDDRREALLRVMELESLHAKPLKLEGLGVYT